MSDEESTKDDKSKKPNPFLEKLKDNQVAQAREALLRTVCEDNKQTIGGILDALEEDDDGDYIMLEIFKRLTLEDLVNAVTGGAVDSMAAASATPAASAPVDEDDDDDDEDEEEVDDDLDDDDEFDDDDDDLVDEDESAEPPPKKKSKKKPSKGKGKKDKKSKGKGKGKGKKDKKSKGKSKDKGSGKKKKSKKSSAKGKDEGSKKPTKKSILSCLKRNKAVDEDSALTSQNIRKDIGGTADDLRPLLKELYEEDSIDKCGEARGTSYFIA